MCQGVLDVRGMPDYWALSVVVPIFNGKGDAMSCRTYRGVKLFEHAMKIVQKVLEWRLWCMVKVDEMQFGFYRQRNDRCSVHFGAVLRQKIVCALLTWRRHLTGSCVRYWSGQ